MSEDSFFSFAETLKAISKMYGDNISKVFDLVFIDDNFLSFSEYSVECIAATTSFWFIELMLR